MKADFLDGVRWATVEIRASKPEIVTIAKAALPFLSPSEQARYRDLPRSTAETAIVGRYLIRHCLGRLLEEASDVLRIVRSATGKPGLEDHALHFSLSHSKHTFLLALSTSVVGVDVEEAAFWHPRLAARFCPASDNETRRPSLSERKRTFIRSWTIKEACVKAAGLGLRDLRHVRVPEGSRGSWGVLSWQLIPSPADAAAVAWGPVSDLPAKTTSGRFDLSGPRPEIALTYSSAF